MNALGLELLHELLMRSLCIENALLAFLELFVILQFQNTEVLACETHAFVDKLVRELLYSSRREPVLIRAQRCRLQQALGPN